MNYKEIMHLCKYGISSILANIFTSPILSPDHISLRILPTSANDDNWVFFLNGLKQRWIELAQRRRTKLPNGSTLQY